MVNSIITFPDGSEQQEKRICQRIELNKQVQLQLADGQLIIGSTEDISLGGLRLITGTAFNHECLLDTEQIALLKIVFPDGQLSSEFPCTIVRCDSGSICLKLDKKKAASFGMMLTRGSLRQKKKKI